MRISDWSSDVCSSDLLEILDRESRIAMSDARAAATYGNRLTALAYSRSWMENPVSALTPDARKKREKKSDGTWQKRVVKATKKVMRQQEIDSLFASVEQAMTAPTEPKESIAKQIARVKPKGTVKLTAALFKKKAEV